MLPEPRPICLPALALALLILGLPVRGGAEPVALPPELDGRLLLELRSCEARLGQVLMAATVRARTGPTAVALPNLRCGAFAAGSDQALFLNAVDGLERIPAHTTRQVTAFFPADARHTECRCVVGDVRRIEREQGDDAFAGSDRDTAAIDDAIAGWQEFLEEMEGGAAPDPELAAGALRREEILVPDTAIRDRPDEAGAVLERLPAGEAIAILALSGGHKRVRTRAGTEGWIPSGASSVDSARAAVLALTLAPARLSSGTPAAGGNEDAPPTGALDLGATCSEIRSEDLTDLVFALLPESRTAYVRPVWYALETADQDAFQHWASACFGVTRIIDVARGLEVRNTRWGDAPASRP